MNGLKSLFGDTYSLTLLSTQDDVMHLADSNERFHSAQLGNALRNTVSGLKSRYENQADQIKSRFRGQMMRLVDATDAEIVDRRIEIDVPETTDALTTVQIEERIAREKERRTALNLR